MQIWQHVPAVLGNLLGLREQAAAGVSSCIYFRTLLRDVKHWFTFKIQR